MKHYNQLFNIVSLKYSRSNFGVKNLTLPTLAVLLNLGLMIILVGARIVAGVLLKMEHFVLLIMLIQKKPQVVSHYKLDIYRNLQFSIYVLYFRGNYSFLNLEIVENLNSCPKFQFLLNKPIFCCGNYSWEETIQGQ